MLTDLNIHNIAIIDRLHVTFEEGFNVLTGETGAGKSIIIDAVNLLLGGRARVELIRTGEEQAVVEGVFSLVDLKKTAEKLEAFGYPVEPELHIKRTLSRNGKNRIFINGGMGNLAQLQEIATDLITIYGQHEQYSLLRSDRHLHYLDQSGDYLSVLDGYREQFEAYSRLKTKLNSLSTDEREREQRLDLLRFQCSEIEDAELQIGEDLQLDDERLQLQHAEQIHQGLNGAYALLYGEEGAASETISTALQQLDSIVRYNSKAEGFAQTVRDALASIEDVSLELRSCAEGVTVDPVRLQEVDDRLDLLKKLKRKYAPTVEEILAYYDQIVAECDELIGSEKNRDELVAQLADLEKQLSRSADELTAARKGAAELLTQAMERELGDLAMINAAFKVIFTATDEPTPLGQDMVEFYLAANAGEEAKALVKIASGGELSRIMLALKRVVTDGDGVTTSIFDEVDSGIGGETATVVGEKLKLVASSGQALCITHLPQIAAFADRHYHVRKQEQAGRTVVSVELLDDSARVAEMARMLGGAHVTEGTLIHARDLIERSGGRRMAI